MNNRISNSCRIMTMVPLIALLSTACNKPNEVMDDLNSFRWCGKMIEAWGDSLTDSPTYMNGQGIYASWYMVDALGYDKIIYNRTDVIPDHGTVTRNVLEKNQVHNFGYPGRSATELDLLHEQEGKPTYAQVLRYGRNGFTDTAAITRAYDRTIARLEAVGNNSYLIVGLINDASRPDEALNTPLNKLVRAYNASLLAKYKLHYLNPLEAFRGEPGYEPGYGIPLMKYTKDGLHENQEGAKREGLYYATRLVACDAVGAK